MQDKSHLGLRAKKEDKAEEEFADFIVRYLVLFVSCVVYFCCFSLALVCYKYITCKK